MGERCRYDGMDNKNSGLLAKLQGHKLIPFCPEDNAFGTPRPTMDLIRADKGIKAISNETGCDLGNPIRAYAINFFNRYMQIDLFIGKERSPSCGVCSARVYDEEKNLLSSNQAGLMAQEAQLRDIPCVDAEDFKDML